jgi:hypothetical protein
MGIVDYFKDLKAISGDFISETAEAKKHLDVKFDWLCNLSWMISKKTSEYQFQAQELMRLMHYRLKFKTSSQSN